MLNIDAAVLQAAMKKAEQVLGDQKKLRDALTTTSDSIPTAAGALERAALVLGEEQTAIMLDGAAAGGAHRAFDEARKNLDLLNARLPALRARLAASDQNVVAASEELGAASNDYAHRRLAEYQVDLRAAAEAFAVVLRQGSALADAMGLSHVGSRLRNIQLKDPVSGEGWLINMTRARLFPEGGGFVSVPSWRGDPAAEVIIEQHAELVDLRRCLSVEVKRIGGIAEHQQLQDEALRAERIKYRPQPCLTIDAPEDPERVRQQQLIDAHIPLQTTHGF